MGLCPLFTVVSCIDNDPVKDAYYTFTGQTVASYLTDGSNNGEFSDFVQILERAELMGLLKTYGEFTCFAPTNEAIQNYLKQHDLPNLDALQKEQCDTLAWMHLVNGQSIYISDIDESSSRDNMNKRHLTFTCDSTADSNGNIIWRVNGSPIIAHDDSVTNGVVHIVNTVINASSTMIQDEIMQDETMSLFAQAFNLTHLADSMTLVKDSAYEKAIEKDLRIFDNGRMKAFGGRDVHWYYPEERLFKYTLFIEPDSVFHAKGIYTIDDLIEYANKIYDETYKEDAGKHPDFTDRKNPLNRFISYHILDRDLTYENMTVSDYQSINTYFQTEKQDIMEFYETMCPFTIMKISDAGTEKYINRRGLGEKKVEVRGCRILRQAEAAAINKNYETIAPPNGAFYYIDDILTYNKTTIDKVLNIRIRIDATTLSPDFSNSGARNNDPRQMTNNKADFFMMRFAPGFTKNYVFGDQTFYAVHNRVGFFNSWEGDNNACLGAFDIKFKLPPVPAGQTYEVRLGYTAGDARTVVQIYFDDNLTGDMPCGIPVDLRKYGGEYGWQSDEELDNDDERIEANDKALRNNGCMKGYDSYLLGGSTNARTQAHILRRILTTKAFEPEHNYYIRLRQVLENQAEMSLDYIEIVPKSVYAGVEPEDKH